ncbi:MAG: type III pantothenate kinase [Bacteroidia bacterium]
MTDLAVDSGNTNIKAGLFEENVLKEIFVLENKEWNLFHSVVKKNKVQRTILSSVGEINTELESLFQTSTRFYKLSAKIKLPFKINYRTPETLGADRLAGVAGAMHFYPKTHCLVIDAGTCITSDFITAEEEYLGGSISPGLQMRLNTMHRFTSRLPEIKFTQPIHFIGKSTESSMLSGVYNGIADELNGTIHRYESEFGNIQNIICGGDSSVFANRIKSNIFAAPYLVLYGLKKILDCQDE